MGLIQNELEEVRKLCEHCIKGSKLVSCVETMVRVEINQGVSKRLIVCFQFPDDYPDSILLSELKSKTLPSKFLDKLQVLLEQELKKYIGKPQILKALTYLNIFLEENNLIVCYDEIAVIKGNLNGGDELKLRQKTSTIILKLLQGNYFAKIKITVPDNYPEHAIIIEDFETNLSDSLKRFLLGQAKEISRQCVEPSITRLIKPAKNKSTEKKFKELAITPRVANNKEPFKPSPSLQKVILFLIQELRKYPLEKCHLCNRLCLPKDPELLEKDESAEYHAERLYCGHLLHLQCLLTYMKTPPFHDGKMCPTCGERIYHEKWRVSEKLTEARWAHQQARERELKEVAEFLE